ncbi:MAG: alkaline phosphatase family protein [Myxococcota bacterium]|jgi:predicted AlkP superfamily phosphohydrolase/phosphomutase|nr:alkaline phosphatase family protein [Myxococcota bacterium]
MLRPAITARSPRLLVFGIDGAGLDLVDSLIARGDLPVIGELLSRSAVARCRSTTPPTTLPAWTTFLSGAHPSTHGVPDFTVRRGYRVHFVGGASRACPTWLSYVEFLGLTVGTAFFPATFPPEKLRGYQISGWDSPVTTAGDSSFVHPQSLHGELRQAFGKDALAFDAIDEFSSRNDLYDRAATLLPRAVQRKADVAAFLLCHRPVDVAMFYFGETDTAAHHFWAFFDRNSPRRPSHVRTELEQVLPNVYRAVDRAIGTLIDIAGPETAIALVSDHGSAGSSDVALHLNNVLSEAGLLAKRRRGLDAQLWRGRAASFVPSPLRRSLFRLAGGLLPSLVESHVRFGDIDWSRTRAFSEELGYAPSIWFNQLGREPQGVTRARDRRFLADEVRACLLQQRDDRGRRLVRDVVPREELHQGPLAHLLPDLWIELETLDGYEPVCLPSSTSQGHTVRRLREAERLGRKGRSLPGCHSAHGLFSLHGRGAPWGRHGDIALQDTAPTLMSALGLPPAPWFEGTTRFDLEAPSPSSWTAVDAPLPAPYAPDEERLVAQRLRRLGYLDE